MIAVTVTLHKISKASLLPVSVHFIFKFPQLFQRRLLVFAVTMLECFTWKEAFPKSVYRFAWNIADAIAEGKRPSSVNEISNKKIVDIIERSWCQNPTERLTINDLVALLETQIMKIKHCD